MFSKSLTAEERERAYPKMVQAAKHLKKNVPKKGLYTEELILRNYTLIEKSKSVFAFANFMRSTYADKGETMRAEDMVHVAGGTGWVVQMVIDHNRDHPEEWKQLMVFDITDERWLELFPSEGEEEYIAPENPAIAPFMFTPIGRNCVYLTPHSTVVGTCNITDVVHRAMRELFNDTAYEIFRKRKNSESPYDEWVAKMLHDNSGMWRKENRCPDPPGWYPEPPPPPHIDLDRGNPFPWMFVRGIGFVRRRPFLDRWNDRKFKPQGTGEWDMFYGNPKVEEDESKQLAHAVRFWEQRVESEWEDRMALEEAEDQTCSLPNGIADRMCHECAPHFEDVCLNIEDMDEVEEMELSSRSTCSVV